MLTSWIPRRLAWDLTIFLSDYPSPSINKQIFKFWTEKIIYFYLRLRIIQRIVKRWYHYGPSFAAHPMYHKWCQLGKPPLWKRKRCYAGFVRRDAPTAMFEPHVLLKIGMTMFCFSHELFSQTTNLLRNDSWVIYLIVLLERTTSDQGLFFLSLNKPGFPR